MKAEFKRFSYFFMVLVLLVNTIPISLIVNAQENLKSVEISKQDNLQMVSQNVVESTVSNNTVSDNTASDIEVVFKDPKIELKKEYFYNNISDRGYSVGTICYIECDVLGNTVSGSDTILADELETYSAELILYRYDAFGRMIKFANRKIRLNEAYNAASGEIVVETNSRKINTATNFSWKLSIYKEGDKTPILDKQSEMFTVSIPKPLQVTVENLTATHDKKMSQYNSEAAYEAVITVSGNIQIEGTVAENASRDNLKKELSDALSHHCLETQLYTEERGKNNVLEQQYSVSEIQTIVEELLNEGGSIYQAQATFSIDRVGQYNFVAIMKNNTSQMAKAEMVFDVEEIEQELLYQSDNTEVNAVFGKTYTYTREKGYAFDNVECYESDAQGNRILKNNRLKIEEIMAGSTYKVSVVDMDETCTPVYITFYHKGKGVYKDATVTYEIGIDRAPLNANISICDSSVSYVFRKGQNLKITSTFITENASLLRQYYKDFEIDLQLIAKSEAENNLNIKLDSQNKKGWSIRYINNQAVFEYRMPAKIANQLRSGETYFVQGTLSYSGDKAFPYSLDESGFIYESLKIENDNLLLNIEDQEFEYSTGSQKLAVSVMSEVTGTEIDLSKLNYTVSSGDTNIIAVNEDGTLLTKKGGKVAITFKADDLDNEKEDMYNPSVKTIYVTVTSPSNTEYTVNNMNSQEFWMNPDAIITKEGLTEEHWFKDKIVVRPAEGNLYDEIVYRIDGGEWINAGAEWVIDKTRATNYDFYFCDTEANIYSYRENEYGEFESLLQIGVDAETPKVNTNIAVDKTQSIHSTEELAYFSEEINLTVYSEKEETAFDAGAGIKEIKVMYDNENEMNYPISLSDRYIDSYSITLNENYMYGDVRIVAVDYMGFESEIARYEKKICIDKQIPDIGVTSWSVDENRKVAEYNGEWTNEMLIYELELESQQSAGIYCYEYAFVPRGEQFHTDTANWEKIAFEDMQVLFDNHVQMNGELYFRAQSNAGLCSDAESVRREIRIWQENIENAKVTVSKPCDVNTGWYNEQTGTVSISFEYPEYQADKYAPAIGVVYEWTQETLTESKTIRRTFYKGILNEATGEITEVTDFMNSNSVTSLVSDGTICIDTDSINKIVVYTQDAAGNKSNEEVYEIKADYTAPQQIHVMINDVAELAYNNPERSIIYNKFFNDSVNVKGMVEYGVSGKDKLYMIKSKALGDEIELNNAYICDEITFEACERGFVYLYAVDGAGNTSAAWTDGIVVDNESPVGNDNLNIDIAPNGANSWGFYNKDIPVSIMVKDIPNEDNYSGLKSVSYVIGTGEGETTQRNLYRFNIAQPEWKDISESVRFSTSAILVSAEENESNEAYIKVIATDNAGNTKVTTQNLKIDVTKPIVEVSYDNNIPLNNKYYSEKRVAKIQVTELNFDAGSVEFIIKKDGEYVNMAPALTSWQETDENVHTAYITFDKDGDYSFSVKCKDLADNYAEYQREDSFTIDLTKPVVEVTYDNNEAHAGNYYDAFRTATITVTERNFDEESFVATVSPVMALSNWSHNKDVHRATVYFNEDGYYTMDLAFKDLAGNEINAFEQQDFHIDTEAPAIKIMGVENGSANAGEVIPVVVVSDTNYDVGAMQISLHNSKGQSIALEQEVTAGDEYQYILTNVNGQPDEIYTLNVIGADKAGNLTQMSYLFSLNRHGSTYDLSEVAGLVETVYLRYADMKDLHIKEMNVDTIEKFNIYITRNGQLITDNQELDMLPESVDENVVYYNAVKSGDETKGYQYNYTLYKENFKQEGIYNVMLYSKDRAGNEINNTLTEKGAEMVFVIDNTAPTVVIEGVESGQFYAEDSKQVNVYVSDNFKLKEACFYLADEQGNQLQTYNYMELAESEGDVVTLTLPHHDKRLSISYKCVDQAGNDVTILPESEAVPTSFMISTNAWLRFVNNRYAVWASMVGIAVIVMGGGIFFVAKRRKK